MKRRCTWDSRRSPKAARRRILKRRLAALGDLRESQVQRLFIEQKAVSFPELVLLRTPASPACKANWPPPYYAPPPRLLPKPSSGGGRSTWPTWGPFIRPA